ncbi:MAG: hypothetical protein NTW11_01245 [Candidatus Staskawiczbacteria bacterium]|nr:hypothetical protein [Candidatus Staskawiczbacteria bacterium]
MKATVVKSREEFLEAYKDVYKDAGELIEGRRWVKLKETGRMFHVLADDSPAYKQTYTWVGDYSEGLAPAREDMDPSLINHNGIITD